MSDNKDTTLINRWDGGERRTIDRREESGRLRDLENLKVSNKRTKNSDRRKSQRCFTCGHEFTPKHDGGCVCESCRTSALRMGNPVGWF